MLLLERQQVLVLSRGTTIGFRLLPTKKTKSSNKVTSRHGGNLANRWGACC